MTGDIQLAECEGTDFKNIKIVKGFSEMKISQIMSLKNMVKIWRKYLDKKLFWCIW